MHDTVDKWMFAQSQRTLSHGCLRLRNPDEDGRAGARRGQGLGRRQGRADGSAARYNNEIVIEKKIPMHLVYFTAWVGDDGKVRTFGRHLRPREAHYAGARGQVGPRSTSGGTIWRPSRRSSRRPSVAAPRWVRADGRYRGQPSVVDPGRGRPGRQLLTGEYARRRVLPLTPRLGCRRRAHPADGGEPRPTAR